MKNSYRFFQNRECEYFPCHKVKNEESFNCLFCYCPLYFHESCGGNCNYVEGIKDCSSCMIPHSENGYDHIVGKIINHNDSMRRKNQKNI